MFEDMFNLYKRGVMYIAVFFAVSPFVTTLIPALMPAILFGWQLCIVWLLFSSVAILSMYITSGRWKIKNTIKLPEVSEETIRKTRRVSVYTVGMYLAFLAIGYLAVVSRSPALFGVMFVSAGAIAGVHILGMLGGTIGMLIGSLGWNKCKDTVLRRK